ncbi:MAG: hypothetical protein LBU32_22630 [Clostridiales bacterium]|nr:hypothetical protein [Clostridiales bacterium]
MMDRLREFISAESDKLKDMTFKEKASYIWEYYKIPIIVAVAVIFLAGSLVDAIWIHPPKKMHLQIAFLEGYQSEEAMDAFAGELEAALLSPAELEEQQIMGASFMSGTGDPQMDMANSQKFFAMVAANDIDFLIFPEEALQEYANQGMCSDLGEILDASLLDKLEGRLVRANDETGFERMYAVRVDGIPIFEKGLNVKGQVLAICVSSHRTENAKKAAAFIFG